jgi:DNA polymerase III subunit gamma/tau
MSQALYRKWRPQKWEQLVGQEHIVTTLQNAVRSERVGHAYLFAGPRGTGKTSSARLLAKAVNCLHDDLGSRPCDECQNCKAIDSGSFLDLIEIDAASNTSVDDIRDLRDKINFSPSQGRFKVYIIDEVHMLSTAAFNALLKTLEEPPAHAIFVLATTEIHKIPATVLSRCQRHEFRRIPVNEIVSLLKNIAEAEGFQYDEDAMLAIARQSTGAMRDAISLLDQLASTGEKITLENAQHVLGTATDESVLELVDAILQKDPAAGLDCLHKALDRGSDARQYARQVVDYLRDLLLIKLNNQKQIDATADMLSRMKHHANAFTHSALIETINAFNQAASDLRSAWQPGLPLELALASAMTLPEAASPQVVSEKPVAASEPVQKSAPPKPVQQVATSPQFAPEVKKQAPSPPAEPPQESPSTETAAIVSAPTESTKAPDTPPVASVPPEESAPPVEIDLNTIKKNWRNIRSLVREHSKPAEALLNSCKLITIRKGVLILGFATPVLQSKMGTPENLELTRNAIAHLLGMDIPVTTVVTKGNSGELPPDLDLDADGMVSTALNLGGKIVKQD